MKRLRVRPYIFRGSVKLYSGDLRIILPALGEKKFDAVVTDPPYGINFLGETWDHEVPGIEYWEKILASAKPGAYLLAFCGTRKFHRLAVAIEDAGWEVRDCLCWLYGTGFPKNVDVSKAIDRKLGFERKVIGIGESKVSGLTKEGYRKRVYTKLTEPTTELAKKFDGFGTAIKPAWEPILLARRPLEGTVAENVLRHGTGGLNIDACMLGDEEISVNGGGNVWTAAGWEGRPPAPFVRVGRFPANVAHDGGEEVIERFPVGSSRFFYCAKVSRAERGAGNDHPTVKPIALMRWLLRLVTPPGGTVLDSFAGSGSTLLAAREEGFRSVGIELSERYCGIASGRLGPRPWKALRGP